MSEARAHVTYGAGHLLSGSRGQLSAGKGYAKSGECVKHGPGEYCIRCRDMIDERGYVYMLSWEGRVC